MVSGNETTQRTAMTGTNLEMGLVSQKGNCLDGFHAVGNGVIKHSPPSLFSPCCCGLSRELLQSQGLLEGEVQTTVHPPGRKLRMQEAML